MYRWFTEVWNEGQEESVYALMSPDAVVHGVGGTDGPPAVGHEAFLGFYHGFREQFDNIHFDLGDTVKEGDLEVVRCRVTAVHKASGKPVDFTGMTMARVADGMFVEGWNNFDFNTMEKQLAG